MSADQTNSDRRLNVVVGESAFGDDGAASHARSWLGVRFDCCGVYARIYRHADQTAYVGACPRCRRILRVPVGPGGTSQRIFRAG